MEITSIQVCPVAETPLKAYVTIVIDDCFVVRGLRVIHGSGGLFVAMPSRRREDGGYSDVAHPLNAETRFWMESEILHAYRRELAGRTLTPPSVEPLDELALPLRTAKVG